MAKTAREELTEAKLAVARSTLYGLRGMAQIEAAHSDTWAKAVDQIDMVLREIAPESAV